MLFMALLVTIDVTLRKLFSTTLPGVPELSGYVFSISTTWAFSFVVLRRANIRIDTLYSQLGPPVRAVLDLIGLTMLAVAASVLTYYAVFVFIHSWERNSRAVSTLGTPLWIPQLFWASGLVLFLFTVLFLMVYVAATLARRNWALAARLAGIPALSETIEEEIHDAR